MIETTDTGEHNEGGAEITKQENQEKERHKGLFLSSVLLPVTWTSTHYDSILTILKDRKSCQRIYNSVPTLKLFILLLNHGRRRTRLLYRFVVSFKDDQTFCPSLSVLLC